MLTPRERSSEGANFKAGVRECAWRVIRQAGHRAVLNLSLTGDGYSATIRRLIEESPPGGGAVVLVKDKLGVTMTMQGIIVTFHGRTRVVDDANRRIGQ
ncbi:hypothetical protein MTR72_15335 [Bradyrhizobium sp. ISRA442]|uniref:hypothetical protein n=1 Tax=Bradyrhizobium sp. ISRA442 TaxID=2866197 RepID=UPI00311B26C8